MFAAHRQLDPFILSSACPYSCGLIEFAVRLGGTIDSEFLEQCQIIDSKVQKRIDALKPIPLNFETTTDFGYEEDIFLDMGLPNTTKFYDPWEFKQYNSWLESSDQWNSVYDNNNDIFIDLM